ncbi:hypothetical protein MMC26_001914 [Xylographa opegraphella]|nr:hypothetical protein [Xylographa opegraphella]
MAAVYQSSAPMASDEDGATYKPLAVVEANKAIGATFEMMNLKGNDVRGVVITVEEAAPATAFITPSVTIQPPSPAGTTTLQADITDTAHTKVEHFPPPPPLKNPPTTAQKITSPKRALVVNTGRPSSPLRMSTYPEPPTTRPSSPVQGSIGPQSHRSSPTLVRNGSIGSTGTHSPIMRSMFPRFNPAVPLARQDYMPTIERGQESTRWQVGGSAPQAYSPSLYSPPSSPPTASQSNWRNTSSCYNGINQSPLRVSDALPSNLSTPEELLDMWSIANGQGSIEAAATYKLGLQCADLTPSFETISFTSSLSPVYSLCAASSALTITRTHPLNPTPTIPITSTTLTTPSTSSPLLASIFPALAELLALDQASSIAIAHNLNRHDSDDLQAEALRRTRETEAANLLWDSDSSRYYLIHPTLADGEPATFPFAIDTATHTISLLSATTPGAPPLLTLSLATDTLSIHTHALTAPDALYVLDTLLAALLTILLHLHRTATPSHSHLHNHPAIPSPALTLSFAPPPTSPLPAARKSCRASKAGKILTTPRSLPGPFDSTILSPSQTLDLEKGITVAPELHRSTGVDLSRFQSYDLEDPKLNAGTRAVLRVLYWAFGVLVWLLGVGLGILAAAVVAVGKGVGRL